MIFIHELLSVASVLRILSLSDSIKNHCPQDIGGLTHPLSSSMVFLLLKHKGLKVH